MNNYLVTYDVVYSELHNSQRLMVSLINYTIGTLRPALCMMEKLCLHCVDHFVTDPGRELEFVQDSLNFKTRS